MYTIYFLYFFYSYGAKLNTRKVLYDFFFLSKFYEIFDI